MKNRLFVIGNGFDLAHNLPTSFDKDFKRIAISNEIDKDFWELYQIDVVDIWSDFENSLGHPDFNWLEQIFDGYYPDYSSDHESDRDAIITLAEISGNLNKSLNDFATNAEKHLANKQPLKKYQKIFCGDDIFISFNYTHTLERLYGLRESSIFHIHGEIGKSDLIIGYPKGYFKPAIYKYDVRGKGSGPYLEIELNDYIKRITEDENSDYYRSQAFETLFNKVKLFSKEFNQEKCADFLNDRTINEINIIGHSLKIDFEFFEYLNKILPNVNWVFNPYNEDDEKNTISFINRLQIHNFTISQFH